jgi:hypothetical protein
MDRLTEIKVKNLTESGNLEKSGVVLIGDDGRRIIVEMGVVRYLTNDEMWSIMHPQQHAESVIYEGKTYSLAPCPFCGGGITTVRPIGRVWGGMGYGEPSSIEIMHYCDPVEGQPSRPVVRVGRDIQSAVNAWNKRK